MIDASTAITTTLAANQTQAGMIALRLALESERQVADLLAQNVAPASNPAHLGNQIDTYA
jgi:hypothetical protein